MALLTDSWRAASLDDTEQLAINFVAAIDCDKLAKKQGSMRR